MDDQTLATLLCEDLIEAGCILELHPPRNKIARIERLAQLIEDESLWRLRILVRDSEEVAAYERGVAARQPVDKDAATVEQKQGMILRSLNRFAELTIGI